LLQVFSEYYLKIISVILHAGYKGVLKGLTGCVAFNAPTASSSSSAAARRLSYSSDTEEEEFSVHDSDSETTESFYSENDHDDEEADD
jgi:hypothetical protein